MRIYNYGRFISGTYGNARGNKRRTAPARKSEGELRRAHRANDNNKHVIKLRGGLKIRSNYGRVLFIRASALARVSVALRT